MEDISNAITYDKVNSYDEEHRARVYYPTCCRDVTDIINDGLENDGWKPTASDDSFDSDRNKLIKVFMCGKTTYRVTFTSKTFSFVKNEKTVDDEDEDEAPLNESAQWDDFSTPEAEALQEKYLPVSGEGDTMANQAATATSKLIYKWFNDGDVFDNTGYLFTGVVGNDLSSYANWLNRYVDGAGKILNRVFDCRNEGEYQDLLFDLLKCVYNEDTMNELAEQSKRDSVYSCSGPFEVEEYEDEDEEDW